MHGLTIARQRLSTSIGLFELVGDVPKSLVQRRFGGSVIFLVRLMTLPVQIQVGRLQPEAEVLLRFAREPLNLPRNGRFIASR